MIRKYFLLTGFIAAMLLISLTAPALGGQAFAQASGADGALGIDADVGASFTYQGYLQQNGAASNGSCDFEFKLYDASSGGSQVGSTQTRTGTSVTQGRFTVELDFGPSAFNGQARWLEISVRCPAGSGSYTTLAPRQPLTPAPYAHSLRPGAVIEGDVNTPDGILNLTNNGSGSGMHVQNTGADGLLVCATGAETTCTPNNSIHSGVEVANAEHYGLWVTTAGDDGVFIDNAGDDGVQVVAAGDDGLDITASDDGLRVRQAGGNGVQVESASKDGLYVCATGSENPNTCEDGGGNNGVEVYRAEDYGVYVGSAGNDGFIVTGAGDNGFQAGIITNDGFYVTEAGQNGFHVESAGEDGLFVCAAGNVSATPCDNRTQFKNGVEILRTENYGVYVENAGVDGFHVGAADDDGFHVGAADDDGFRVTQAGNHGFHAEAAANAGLRVQNADIGVHVDSARLGLLVESATNGVQVDSASGNGLVVGSANTGIYINGPVTNWAGYFTGNVNVTGTCTGCVLAAMAVNTGDSTLQPGDVVALQGSRVDASTGQPLVMEVGRATAGAPLVGVVYGRGELTEIEKGDGQMATQVAPRTGAAQPGDFVHIVLDGPAQVKASALDGTIALGQKLTVGNDGAARALKTVEVDGVQLAESASTIGMALEDSAVRADGLIWVLVNPQ